MHQHLKFKLFLLFALVSVALGEEANLLRIRSDVDSRNCLCGLNSELLDQLARVIEAGNSQCSSSGAATVIEVPKESQVVSSGSLRPNNEDANSGTQHDSSPSESKSDLSPNSSSQHTSNQSADNHENQSNSAKSEVSESKGSSGNNNNNNNNNDNPSPNQVDDKENPNSFPQSSGSSNQNSGGQSEGTSEAIKNLQAQLAQLIAAQSNGGSGPNTISVASDSSSPSRPSSSTQNADISPAQSAQGSTGGSSSSNSDAGGQKSDGQPTQFSTESSNDSPTITQIQPSTSVTPVAGSSSSSGQNAATSQPSSFAFLQGIPGVSTLSNFFSGSNRPSQANPSQNAQQIQSALVSTVPNVVSNIFSSIQNLSIQTEQDNMNNANDNSESKGPGMLTSIDGNSVQLTGTTTDMILDQGEQLFASWVQHQLHGLHLTASMAAYIQRNALNLFRRILKQYVERIERLGGRVEENVRRATQIALYNTENLVAFILRNYINFAGGLLRIIGEQVSNIGKQLDSTGETIAHMNLNPFDIVSNVIDHLPNPSTYSEYFRAFGKYLMGETQSLLGIGQQQQQPESAAPSASAAGGQQQEASQPQGGLFRKTVGALSKTLGSWLG